MPTIEENESISDYQDRIDAMSDEEWDEYCAKGDEEDEEEEED